MMDSNTFLEISLVDKRFVVELNPHHEYYQKAYIIVRGLLTAYERGDNKWVIGYDDVGFLRDRLNQFGLVDGRVITQEAMRFLQWLEERWEEREEIKKGGKNDYVKHLIKGKLKKEPYEDQVTAIAYAYQNPRVGIFDSMGMGKSLEVLGTIVALSGSVQKTLIICPLNVVPGFLREVEKHTHLKAVSLPTGRKTALAELEKVKKGKWDILITHPENLVGEKNNVLGPITKLLKTMKFDYIVIDEFHRYKNIEAKRTKCVLSLLEEIKSHKGEKARCALLTGTPISESPLNAYTVLKVLSFVPNYIRFENHFCTKKNVDFGGRSYKVITGYKNLPDLKRMVERVSIRRTKEEMVGFPPITAIQRDVLLTGKQRVLYNAIAKDLLHVLDQKTRVNLENWFVSENKAIRLRQVLNSPGILDEDGDSAKYIELDNILEELLADPDQKVIIWTEYRKAVDMLHERYNDLYGSIKLYGGVKIDEALINQFENDKKPQVAVAIPAKAGEGTDFLARARTAIYVDRPYSYTQFSQSMDRIHRRTQIDQNSSKLDRMRALPALIIFLDAVGSIDELVRDKLYDKERMEKALTVSDEKLITLGRADLIKYIREIK